MVTEIKRKIDERKRIELEIERLSEEVERLILAGRDDEIVPFNEEIERLKALL